MSIDGSRTKRATLIVRLALLAMLANAGGAGASIITDVQYSGAWKSDVPPSQLVLSDDLEEFTDDIDYQWTAHAKVLVAFESWTFGTRHFGGLFRAHPRSTSLLLDYSAAEFETLRLAQVAAQRRLLDVEVQMVGGVRRYSGLWEQMTQAVTETVLDNVDGEDLLDYWDDHKSDSRLVVFDTWWDGEPRYYAVFRPGAELPGTQLELALPIESVSGQFEDQSDSGYRVADFEITVSTSGDLLVSFKWAANPYRSWLGISFREAWMPRANSYLAAGYDFTGADDDFDPGGFFPPTDLEEPIYLFDFEMSLQHTVYFRDAPDLVKPRLNSGTPGPDKP